MRIIVPTAPPSAVAAGVVAASLTFATMSRASDATVGATGFAIRTVGFLTGRGVNLIFGPVSGFIAEQAAVEFGDGLIKPVIRTGTRQTAYLTSAAIGVTVVALSTVLIHTGSWLYQKGHGAVTRYLTQSPIEVVSNLRDVGNDIMLLSVEDVPVRPIAHE